MTNHEILKKNFGQERGIFCSIFNGFYAFHPKLYYKSLIIGLESWDSIRPVKYGYQFRKAFISTCLSGLMPATQKYLFG